MKKSVIIISAVIVAVSVLFTSCTIGKPTIKDENGTKHVLYTNEDGEVYQDYLGNLFEYKTDSEGNDISEPYSFPKVVTNKSLSKVENSWVKIDVPKKWKAANSTTVLKITHTDGECVDVNQYGCEIIFNSYYDMNLQEKYDKHKAVIENLYSLSADIQNITEYETEICGKKAKAISYRVASENVTKYNYLMTNDYYVFEIEATVYNDCFKDSQSIVDFLGTCITMKNVVNATTTTVKGE